MSFFLAFFCQLKIAARYLNSRNCTRNSFHYYSSTFLFSLLFQTVFVFFGFSNIFFLRQMRKLPHLIVPFRFYFSFLLRCARYCASFVKYFFFSNFFFLRRPLRESASRKCPLNSPSPPAAAVLAVASGRVRPRPPRPLPPPARPRAWPARAGGSRSAPCCAA